MEIYQLQTLLKNRLLWLGLFVCVVAGFIWYFAYHGILTVSTTKDATLTITRLDSLDKPIISSGSLTTSLLAGDYHISAQTTKGATEKTITVNSFSSLSIDLPVSEAAPLDNVSNMPFYNIQETNTGFRALNTDTSQIDSISTNGTYSTMVSDLLFHSIHWTGDSIGIAVSSKQGIYTLAQVSGNNAVDIGLPDTTTRATTLSAVAAKTNYFVIQNNRLYSAAIGTKNFTFLTTVFPNSKLLSSSDENIVYLQRGSNALKLFVYHQKSKKTDQMKLDFVESPDSVTQTSWSPDGSRIAISSAGSATIYTPELKKVLTLPGTSIGETKWRSNDEVVYVSGKYVWTTSLSSNVSKAIGIAPDYAKLLHIFNSTGDGYIYMDSLATGELSIMRLPLNNQTSNTASIYLGESNMHKLSDNCNVGFINYTKTTVVVSGLFAPLTSCQKSVSNYLSAIGIDKKTVIIQTITQ